MKQLMAKSRWLSRWPFFKKIPILNAWQGTKYMPGTYPKFITVELLEKLFYLIQKTLLKNLKHVDNEAYTI